MTRILAITTLNNSSELKEAADRIHVRYGPVARIEKLYLKDFEAPDASFDGVRASIRNADILLVDIRADTRLGRALPRLLADFTGTVVVLIGVGNDIFALTRMGSFRGSRLFKPGREKTFTIDSFIKARRYSELTERLTAMLPFGMLGDMRRWMKAQQYYSEGGVDNLENMLLLLLKHYGGQKHIKNIKPVSVMPPCGLYAPGGGIYTDLEDYRRAAGYDAGRPTVAILTHGGMHFSDTREVVERLYARLSPGVNVLTVFSNIEHNMEALRTWCRDIDLLITMQYFRLWGGPYGGDPAVIYAFLQDADVPLLIGLRAFETELAVWRAQNRGLTPIETVLGITLPELDGAVEPFFLAGLETEPGTAIGTVKRPAAVTDRIARFGNRVLKWIGLRKKNNADKKIALLAYSYPPGEDGLGSAGYLDVFSSLDVFLKKLRQCGYRVDPPAAAKDFFLSSGIVNSPVYQSKNGIRVRAADYKRWFETLPVPVQEAVTARWGPPPGTIMIDNGDIVLPGEHLGNVFLGVQPSRGLHEDDEALYHDKALPPHHQYLAYYYYLSCVYDADAVIHFGMHGTLEFMPGKETALSGECFPDILIGDMPHLYYYWIGNPSEATIAKRRSYALCISHASPRMNASGLYDRYIDLGDLLDQYEQDPSPATLERIRQTAEELHLTGEPAELRRELYRLKRRLIPSGLHVMDTDYSEDDVVDYLAAALRHDREQPSAYRKAAESRGVDWEKIRDGKDAEGVIEDVRSGLMNILQGSPTAWCDEVYRHYVLACAERLRAGRESEGLLRALEGRYVLPARGGDPVRDIDIYPSGRAMYAFDPRLIPTVSAGQRGRAAAGKLLDAYAERNGSYPESMGIVLWGFETMKTGGDTIAMILHLMGMRIRHRASLWLKELEVIPLEELQRPRIDVVVTMCGIFRDTFGTHIDLLNRAFKAAADLDEPPEKNFIRKHCRAMPETCPEGHPLRLFGPAADQYATDLPSLIETGAWDREEQLGAAFADAMSYSYLGGVARESKQALASLLGSVQIVAQERDSLEYEVTDLDHYYEFLGGFSNAAAQMGGKKEKPAVMVVDQADEETEVAEVGYAVERATRTRTLNPRWLDGMLRHDFHGAAKIKDRVEYLMGFAATTGAVSSWVFDQVADTLLFDDAMRSRLQHNNPYATQRMAEVLIESERRGYWEAAPERIKRIRDIVLALESESE